MRRRDFISTACGAAASSAAFPAGSFAAYDDGLALLLQLARVAIPDEASGAWTNGAARKALEDKWRSLDSDTRKGYTAVLKKLDRAALSGGGKDFASVPLKERPEIVRRLMEESKEFDRNFWQMRSMMLYAYYDSPVGMRRTGYYPTTQFVGYPEIDKFPAGRKDD